MVRARTEHFELILDEITDITEEEIRALLAYLRQDGVVPADVETVEGMRHHVIRPSLLEQDDELGTVTRNQQVVYRDAPDGGLEFQFTPKDGEPEAFRPLVAIEGGRVFLFEELEDFGIPNHRFLSMVLRYSDG